MNEGAIQPGKCSKCGVAVRAESQFCYNCGSPVTETAREMARTIVSGSHLDVPIPAPTDARSFREPSSGKTPVASNGASTDFGLDAAHPKLQTAAAVRRRTRTSRVQPVEMVWKGSQRSPVWFVLAAFIFATLTVLMIFAAFYLN